MTSALSPAAHRRAADGRAGRRPGHRGGRRRVAAWCAALAVTASAALAVGPLVPLAQAAPVVGSPTDPNLQFVGRWNTANPAAYVPGWAGAYLTTGFTGTTVKLRQRGTIDLYSSIDGGAFSLRSNVSGTVDLTPSALRPGDHTLTVSYRVVAGSYTGDAVFQGLVLDAGATTRALAARPRLVEFVGDSITVGQTSSQVALTSYPWLVGEQLGARHTQIAQGGACLRELTAAQSTRGVACVGLQRRFTRASATDTAPAWDFSRYTADAVVINLGTNDTSHGVTSADFLSGYTDLLRTVRTAYPRAAILALRTFSGRWATETRSAVAAVTAGGDRNAFFVDTTGWITSALLNDSVHPNDAGHRAVASLLAPIVAAHLPTASTPTPTPTVTPTPTPTPTVTPSTTPTPTPSVTPTTPTASPSRGCTAAYAVSSAWQGGFTANVTVTATSALTGWTVTLALPAGVAVTGVWGGTGTGTSGTVSVANAAWNGTLTAGAATSFGFQATTTGATGATVSCTPA